MFSTLSLIVRPRGDEVHLKAIHNTLIDTRLEVVK